MGTVNRTRIFGPSLGTTTVFFRFSSIRNNTDSTAFLWIIPSLGSVHIKYESDKEQRVY